MINIHNYLADAIKRIVNNALKSAHKNYRELFYLYKFKKSSEKATIIRQRYDENNIHIPPFLIFSITSSCNLHCSGCYARANNSCNDNICKDNEKSLDDKRINELFLEASELGINFILLAGGEPLLRKNVIEIAKNHKKILFPIFTNGTLINDEYLEIFNKNRNLLPILSLEGREDKTDNRRGEGVFSILNLAMDSLNSKNIFYGVSITADKNNLNEVTDDKFIESLMNKGCKVVFYIEYVPMDKKSEAVVLNDNDRDYLDKTINNYGNKYKNMIFLSFPGDEKYLEGCLAAGRGFFHISVSGDAEPCPFSPFSDINLKEHSILEALSSPLFKELNSSGILKEQHMGGCLLHQKEEEVKALLNK